MAIDIAGTLGIGSGINTAQLVADLTNATFGPRASVVNERVSTNDARISALASAKSALGTFSTALTELLKTSGYRGQPASSDPTVASVGLMQGGVPAGLPAQLEVLQLATAQVLQSSTLTASSAVAGTGSLTLTVGAESKTITLASGANTLADLATAINDSGAGVTASVMTDQNGARLVLKGATGESKAFTLTAGADADADLQRFTWDGAAGGMTRNQTAGNALIRLDNVEMAFESNEVTTAIPFVRINLNKAAPGTSVTLATDQPTATMNDLVQEYVSAYNELKRALNSATAITAGTTGLLTADPGVREMSRRLGAMVGTQLADSGPYRTLSDLGVRTERDGTLSLDTAKLEAAIQADPAAVTQMLNPTVPSASNPGIAGALKDVTDYLNGPDGPLTSSTTTYDKLKASLQKDLDKLDEQRGTYSDQLTKTYGNMQTRLLKLQATQSYLDQQIKAWNSSND
ncbi:flagellar hook-associated protein 2 [Sphingobium sp. SYK-6]|uniref:flagellar filament capping protein FliD n=1 Tax=Sphingobium sp. (strain NBRC 103272 / SYK-6) TaxID=627192 RepID=UPI0002276D47|nr:flagellar filament capping protein FliD [Sphingobium sp. SYK-6]BAK64953.1 flagellar hook-associated protein 2 [Sphingobium sp. SYK-6]